MASYFSSLVRSVVLAALAGLLAMRKPPLYLHKIGALRLSWFVVDEGGL